MIFYLWTYFHSWRWQWNRLKLELKSIHLGWCCMMLQGRTTSGKLYLDRVPHNGPWPIMKKKFNITNHFKLKQIPTICSLLFEWSNKCKIGLKSPKGPEAISQTLIAGGQCHSPRGQYVFTVIIQLHIWY